MIRLLELEDFNKGYIDLLKQLTQVGDISYDSYKFFYENLNDNHIILVIEKDNKIVSTGTALIETKLIHNCGKVGHIEDIVTHKDYRGNGYAKKIINKLKKYINQQDCYKVILNCSHENKLYYEKNVNMKQKGICMVEYFK